MQQREIKFRAWDKKYKHWYNATLKPDGWTTHDTALTKSDGEVSPWQQFTGLFDRLGKEIYEGDIIALVCAGSKDNKKEWTENHQIVWTGERYEIGGWSLYDHCKYKRLEVIGNIYQDSHLLKK